MFRRRRRLLYCVLLSIAVHAALVALLFPALLRKWHSGEASKEPVTAISQITFERRAPPSARPKPAVQPRLPVQPAPAHPAAARRRQPVPPHAPSPSRRARAPRQPQLSAAEIGREQAGFAKAISQARDSQDPVTGAASAVVPEAPKHVGFNAASVASGPSPGEGFLTPLRRWTDGDVVYYYVRYSVTYPNGQYETGIVPWPIHFPLAEDPFARGKRTMPLPGPAPDYVASDDTGMHPLVKNCYDHRYDYCPIAREGDGQ